MDLRWRLVCTPLEVRTQGAEGLAREKTMLPRHGRWIAAAPERSRGTFLSVRGGVPRHGGRASSVRPRRSVSLSATSGRGPVGTPLSRLSVGDALARKGVSGRGHSTPLIGSRVAIDPASGRPLRGDRRIGGSARGPRPQASARSSRPKARARSPMSASIAQNAEPPHAEHAPLASVVVPGSTRTYDHRAELRSLGLRWDRDAHHWHGTLPVPEKARLENEIDLPIQVVGVVGPTPNTPLAAVSTLAGATGARSGPQGPREPLRHTKRDGSRTSLEARLVIPLEGEALSTKPSRFTLADITSGLQDDSREADERRQAARLADLRGRVKAARAALSAHPGAEQVLARDWVKEARFYARFGITQAQFRHGVPADAVEAGPSAWEGLDSPLDWLSEVRAREAAVLPGSEWEDG